MKIDIVPYDHRWPALFEAERAALCEALGDVAGTIHHIGSTSVPGLAAKPVIDILLEVDALDALDRKAPAFEALGYEVMGEFGIPGRRYFRKGGSNRTHHIHAFRRGDANVLRHLAFRDYLAHFPEVRREYGALKARLASQFPADIGGYGDGKAPFIAQHEALALAWMAASAP